MEALAQGELNIREAFIQESIQALQDKLKVIDSLREIPATFDNFEFRLFENDGVNKITKFWAHDKDPVMNEVFRPLLEQGLIEYRKRLQEKLGNIPEAPRAQTTTDEQGKT